MGSKGKFIINARSAQVPEPIPRSDLAKLGAVVRAKRLDANAKAAAAAAAASP